MAEGSSAKEAYRVLNDSLCREIGSLGAGAITACDRLMGHRPGYLRQARNNQTLRVSKLFGYLELCGSEPWRFFRKTFPRPDGRGGDELPPRCYCEPVAAFAEWAQAARSQSPYRHLALKLMVLELVESTNPGPLTNRQAARLATLDAQRYQDPKPVVQRAGKLCRRALGNEHGELALRAAGVLASALRLCMRLDDAQVLLWTAFQQAERLRLRAVAADLLQRMVYVVYDRGHYEHGVSLANEANSRYQTLNDPVRVAQTLVDRGIMLFHLGHFRRALEALEAALRDLPVSERGNCCTALQACAFCHLGLGAHQEAARCLRQAGNYLPEGAHYEGRLLWLRAALAAHSSDPAAEARYHQALEVFGEAYPGDAALASIELVHLLLTHDRPAEAQALAAGMRALAMTLPDGTVVQQAVWKLVQGEKELTPCRVHRILAQTAGERSCLIQLEKVGGRSAKPRA